MYTLYRNEILSYLNYSKDIVLMQVQTVDNFIYAGKAPKALYPKTIAPNPYVKSTGGGVYVV